MKYLASIVAFAAILLCAAALPPERGGERLVARAATATATPSPLPSPDRLLFLIRRQFRSHRPPPPYETYTLVRAQLTDYGDPPYPDLVNSYTYHIWCRTYDDACLGRKVYRHDDRGFAEFLRPEFNEARDPGPPTADLFQPAPSRPHAVTEAPTPEPTGSLPPLIASVTVLGEFDYRVTNVAIEGDYIHVSLLPRRDPNRNRLREIYVDRKTLELHRLVATDKFFDGPQVFPMLFTVTLDMLDGIPVVTTIHGQPQKEQDQEYLGHLGVVDYTFKDITFPPSLPAWYFDPRSWASHADDLPI
ncbi:MAG TPA: hypothetical protein VMH02_04455 [Verrucomicrobiae bacterium]|nr:hypothetical protein [Verrucomicrobiae bacterium]